MESNSKRNFLIAAISGIVACLVFVGVIFVFPSKSSSSLKGKDNSLNNNEEINLGDKTCIQSHYGCTAGTLYNGQCYRIDGPYVQGCNGQNVNGNCGVWLGSQVLICDQYAPDPTPTPTPVPSVKCWQLSQGSSCTQKTITGTTTCSGNNKASKDACVSALNCGSKYKNGTACYSCNSGTHSTQSNCVGTQATCCVADATPTPTAAPTTVTCAAGKYLPAQSTTCATCPAGSYCPGGTWRPDGQPSGLNSCGSGKTSSAGAKSANDCYSSSATPSAAPNTVNCSAGTYLPGSSSSCKTCEAGYYCKGGNYPLGNTALIGRSPCGSGKTSNAGAKAESECYSTATPTSTAPTTVTCAAGKYLPAQSTTCATCPAGSYCPGGTWRPDGQPSGLNSCGSGKTSSAGAKSANDCYSSSATPSAAPNTVNCSAGTYLPGSSSSCKTCEAGYYCQGGNYPLGNTALIGRSPCGSGKTSNAGAKAESECYSTAAPVDCKAICTQEAGTDGGPAYDACYNQCVSVNPTPTPTAKPSAYSCSMAFDSATTLRITASTTKSGVTVMKTAINGRETSSLTVTTSGNYSGNAWFSDGGTASCSKSVDISSVSCASIREAGECTKHDNCEWDYTYLCHDKKAECSSISGESKCSERTDCEWKNYRCQKKKVSLVRVTGGGTGYVSPTTCKTFIYTAVGSDGTLVPASWNIGGATNRAKYNCGNSGVCTISVCGWNDCGSASISVSATYDGTTVTGSGITVESLSGWSPVGHKEGTETVWKQPVSSGQKPYIYDDTSLDGYICYGYSGPYQENGVTKYKYKYNRCCGNGGSEPNPTPAPTYDLCCVKNDGSVYSWRTGQSSRSCPSGYYPDDNLNAKTCKNLRTPACYIDGDGGYHWTSDPKDSWEKVPGITKEKNCKEVEEPACYKDSKGEYTWGKHAKDDGYTLITSIKEEDKCVTPKPEDACYKNDENDYIWTDEAPSGYTKVEGVTKPEDCAPEEEPACYLHESDYVWGKFEKINGYIKIENVTMESQCKLPPQEACYKDPDGDYVWGEYSNDDGFTLIPEITDMSDCGIDVPTPKSGIDVAKLVYVFMAILMAFGIGFIYYSTMVKKTKQDI